MYVTGVFADTNNIVVFVDPRAVSETIKKFYSMGAVRVNVDKTSKP